RLNKEWEELCKYQVDNVSTDAAQKNPLKNRSSTILPYDHNRVKLKVEENSMENDYINASYIIDNDPRLPVYIATQGPLSSTIHQFWQMIWEQGCAVIVMLTPVSEEGVSQCARYWPDEGSSNYAKFEIHLVSEHIWCEDYLVRSLYLKNVETGETRTLTQFHFLSWPMNGIPFSPKPLLELRRKVSKCYKGNNSPIVVHCNDGSSRTGTYILIDLVITRMVKGAKEIDVAATLEYLRDQRVGMVASKKQMEFALSSVAEEELCRQHYAQHSEIAKLIDDREVENKNRLNKEWEELCKYQVDNVSTDAAQKNLLKNRSSTILPYDHNRVKLKVEENSMENDYINASYIVDNDPRLPVYIATQGPLSSTIHQFWQMIWEQGCAVIVMLTPVSEEGVSQCAWYWPDEGSSNFAEFEIHLVSEHIWCEDYLVRSLYLKNVETGETRTLTQFHFLSWPSDSIPGSLSILDLRRRVSKCCKGNNSPIVVHCNDGSSRTGTYILIDLVITRMVKGAKEIDVAATLEYLRDQRVGMVASKEQME
uniref:Protein-tyrosine-phosphatase n=1 Tax=Ciona savignyi TaxID=51511 RepID=H2Z467_CIOSA